MAGRSCTSASARLPWSDLFQPAIYFADARLSRHRNDSARRGHPEEAKLAQDENARAVFLRDGRVARKWARCSAIRKWPRRSS